MQDRRRRLVGHLVDELGHPVDERLEGIAAWSQKEGEHGQPAHHVLGTVLVVRMLVLALLDHLVPAFGEHQVAVAARHQCPVGHVPVANPAGQLCGGPVHLSARANVLRLRTEVAHRPGLGGDKAAGVGGLD